MFVTHYIPALGSFLGPSSSSSLPLCLDESGFSPEPVYRVGEREREGRRKGGDALTLNGSVGGSYRRSKKKDC